MGQHSIGFPMGMEVLFAFPVRRSRASPIGTDKPILMKLKLKSILL
jgi:hypothetical protein